jgi:hypothetical protein
LPRSAVQLVFSNPQIQIYSVKSTAGKAES